MSKPCQICSNPQLAEIEEAINNGGTVRGTARLFNVSHDALHRHSSSHMGLPNIAEADGYTEFNALAEINRMLIRNKQALDVTSNPLQSTKLIQQQMELLLMQEKEQAKSSAAKRKEAQLDCSKLNDEELVVMIRIHNRALGLHDEDVIKYGRVTSDPDNQQRDIVLPLHLLLGEER